MSYQSSIFNIQSSISLFSWWQSGSSRCDRIAGALLTLVCLTTIFSTALVQTFVVALAVVVFTCMVSARRRLRRTPLDLPFLAFLAGRVLSVLFSQDPAQSMPALHKEFFFYLVYFLVTQTLSEDEPDAARSLVLLLIFAGVLAALIGAGKVLFAGEPRGFSTTAGPYTLGAYLCPILALSLFFPWPASDQRFRAPRWVVSAVLCIGIVFTLDRMHWVGMLLALAGALFYYRVSSRSHPRPVLALGLGVAAFLAIGLRMRMGQLANVDSFLVGREVILRGAWDLAWMHPLVGFGPRTFVEVFPYLDLLPIRGVSSWHNDYLQVYMESGLLGLLPLLWLVGAVLYHGVRALRSASPVRSALPSSSHPSSALDSSSTLSTPPQAPPSPGFGSLTLPLLAALTLFFLFGGMLDTLVGLTFRIILALFSLTIVDRRLSIVN